MTINYPERIRQLENYDGRFEAFRLPAEGADVLFASYSADEVIPEHAHDTDNYGVVVRGELSLSTPSGCKLVAAGEWYEVQAGVLHRASFSEDTQIIEFWFKPEDVGDVAMKSGKVKPMLHKAFGQTDQTDLASGSSTC